MTRRRSIRQTQVDLKIPLLHVVADKRTFTFTALPLTKCPHSPQGPQLFSQLKTKKKRKEKFIIIGKKNYENFKRNLNNVGPTRKPARKAKPGENKMKKEIGMSEKKNKTPKNWINCLEFDRNLDCFETCEM